MGCRLRDLESPAAGASSPRPPERIVAKSGSGSFTPRLPAGGGATPHSQGARQPQQQQQPGAAAGGVRPIASAASPEICLGVSCGTHVLSVLSLQHVARKSQHDGLSMMAHPGGNGEHLFRQLAPAGGSGVSGKEEARLREVIAAEVLDSRPSVRWSDIAGLAGAKQVGSWGGCQI